MNYSPNRRKGENVHAISCSRWRPEFENSKNEIIEVPISSWNKNAEILAHQLCKFRDESS